jgi:hypothetical protein
MRRHGRRLYDNEPPYSWGAVFTIFACFLAFGGVLWFAYWRAQIIADAVLNPAAMRTCLIWFGVSCT